MDGHEFGKVVMDTVTRVGLRVLGAIALWIVGRILIGFVVRARRRGPSACGVSTRRSRATCATSSTSS